MWVECNAGASPCNMGIKVPLPQSGTPIARISGSFSYEEEGQELAGKAWLLRLGPFGLSSNQRPPHMARCS